MTDKEFHDYIWEYYRKHKRPMIWRDQPSSYYVLVSEIMLQQTQVSRVQEKFPQFIQKFPDLRSLAEASLKDVLGEWQGLGYNRRAKFLWQSAQILHTQYNDVLPTANEKVLQLPGVGVATAGSLVAFAHNIPTVFIETNIRRVYIYHFFRDQENISDTQILPLVAQTVSQDNPREWYYALMDYGTYLKSQVPNPNRKSKHYTRQSQFEGSNRQIRAQIIKELLKRPMTLQEIQETIQDERVEKNMKELVREGIVRQQNNLFSV